MVDRFHDLSVSVGKYYSMVLLAHNVEKIKGAAHKNGDVDSMCKWSFTAGKPVHYSKICFERPSNVAGNYFLRVQFKLATTMWYLSLIEKASCGTWLNFFRHGNKINPFAIEGNEAVTQCSLMSCDEEQRWLCHLITLLVLWRVFSIRYKSRLTVWSFW